MRQQQLLLLKRRRSQAALTLPPRCQITIPQGHCHPFSPPSGLTRGVSSCGEAVLFRCIQHPPFVEPQAIRHVSSPCLPRSLPSPSSFPPSFPYFLTNADLATMWSSMMRVLLFRHPFSTFSLLHPPIPLHFSFSSHAPKRQEGRCQEGGEADRGQDFRPQKQE